MSLGETFDRARARAASPASRSIRLGIDRDGAVPRPQEGGELNGRELGRAGKYDGQGSRGQGSPGRCTSRISTHGKINRRSSAARVLASPPPALRTVPARSRLRGPRTASPRRVVRLMNTPVFGRPCIPLCCAAPHARSQANTRYIRPRRAVRAGRSEPPDLSRTCVVESVRRTTRASGVAVCPHAS